MSPKREQAGRPDTGDRVVELARDIYVTLSISNNGRTPEAHAADAFAKAEAFWKFVVERKQKSEEK